MPLLHHVHLRDMKKLPRVISQFQLALLFHRRVSADPWLLCSVILQVGTPVRSLFDTSCIAAQWGIRGDVVVITCQCSVLPTCETQGSRVVLRQNNDAM